jgi:hypothetical protein
MKLPPKPATCTFNFTVGDEVTFKGKVGVIEQLYTVHMRWNPEQPMARVRFGNETRGLPQAVLNVL